MTQLHQKFIYWKKFVVKLGFLIKYLDFHKTFNQNLFALIIRSKPKCNSAQFKLLLLFRILFIFISMAIEVSSNEKIMPNEGVFQCDVNKSIDLLIFDAIQQVRLRKFSRKHLCQSLFLIKLQVSDLKFLKEDASAWIFSC